MTESFMGRSVIRNSPARVGQKMPNLDYIEPPNPPTDEDETRSLEQFHKETGGNKAVIKDTESIHEGFRDKYRRHFTG